MEAKAKIKGLDSFLRQYACKEGGFTIVNVISMDQPSQTGIKFNAFIKRINLVNQQYKIKKIVIILTDFLQRHYLALDNELSASEINKLANEKGKAWIKMNGETLMFMLDSSIKFEILRWENLLSCNDYVNALEVVNKLYQQHEEFKTIVEEVSQSYADKLQRRLTDSKKLFESAAYFNAARNYSLEESAIWWPLVNLGFDLITYPGCKNEVIEYTYKLFQSEGHSLPWFRYCFEKKMTPNIEKSIENIKRVCSLHNFNLFSSLPREKVSNFKKEQYSQGRRHSL